MSRTYSLACHETRQKIWIGQGRESDREHGEGPMTSLYYGEPETMKRLRRFLNVTKGKPIVLLCDDTEFDHQDYEEFEDPNPEGIDA